MLHYFFQKFKSNYVIELQKPAGIMHNKQEIHIQYDSN